MMILLQYLFSSRNVLITLATVYRLRFGCTRSPASLSVRPWLTTWSTSVARISFVRFGPLWAPSCLPLPLPIPLPLPLPPAWPPSLPLPLLIPPLLIPLPPLPPPPCPPPRPPPRSPHSPPRLTLSLTLSIVLEDRWTHLLLFIVLIHLIGVSTIKQTRVCTPDVCVEPIGWTVR